MSTPRKQFIWRMITVFSIAIVVISFVLLQSQNRSLSQEIKAQNQVIKEQTDINQRYLRCILLIEREKFQDPSARVRAIDECATESKTIIPDTNTSETQNQQIEVPETEPPAPKIETVPSRTPSPSSSPPEVSKNPTQASPPENQQPEPSLIEQVTKPVADLLKSL